VKKKTTKKLSLNRETLTQLEEPVLERVAGGYTERCTYSGYWTCGTCESVCTTNYC